MKCFEKKLVNQRENIIGLVSILQMFTRELKGKKIHINAEVNPKIEREF